MLRVAEKDGALVSASFVDSAEETEPSVPVLCEAEAWLDRYFAGNDPGQTPPLAPAGTAFQKSVRDAIGTVPYGKTTSYSALAVSMGLSPRHARAVGGALHRNPLLLFVPCHRVLGKDGSPTGFACGVERKKALLETEQKNLPRID